MLFTVVASPSLQSAAIWYFIAAVIALCVALDSYFVLPALVSHSISDINYILAQMIVL